MIYEVRTYDLKPNTLAEVEKRFGDAYEKRRRHSELAAFWHTEIGPLNQIIHVWPYESLEERAKVRAAAVKDGTWPPKISEFVVRMHSDIAIPFPFSPAIKPGRMGPVFEMRTYTFASGELPKILKLWERVLPKRLEFGPMCAVWYHELGGLNKFTHIWPYASLAARDEVRQKAVAAGAWPPSTVARRENLESYELVEQENKILLPSAFSPLQ